MSCIWRSRISTESPFCASDKLIVLLTFRHALRVSELVSLQVDHIDLKTASLHVSRAKNGTPGIHGLDGDEMRLIRAVLRDNGESRFLFVSERGAPLSIDGSQKLIERLGDRHPPPPYPYASTLGRLCLGWPWC
jgi:type 1 fimbriae regulatory protein FimB/type 1 fimbriae regulatory protein FimE